ncbi:MAG: hypothetical protein U5L09_17340 [Bacteroidales bacterium]|nr:hypothetical protein [Bacteroidales bacterium]
MESLKIDIINPKAKNLLNSLADMNLIIIREEKSKNKDELKKILKKTRAKSDTTPSLDEITKEVEAVRKARYEG